MKDARIDELEALALEEGFRLPMAADLIAFLEGQGYVVDLGTGEVCGDVGIVLSPNAQALCHLYGVNDDDINVIFASATEDVPALDLSDYEDDMLDREFWARGQW